MEREISISSQLRNIERVREFLLLLFDDCGINKTYFNRVFLGLSEAVCNSIIHGNGLRADKVVNINAECSENTLVFEVQDEGDGFFWDQVSDPLSVENIKKEHGRGILLLKNMADEVEFKDGGRKVLIKYSLPQ
ncbi:MAG: ATP-binding protein [Prolixibacteraceae bacterium]